MKKKKGLERRGRVRGFMGRRGWRRCSWENSFVGIAATATAKKRVSVCSLRNSDTGF